MHQMPCEIKFIFETPAFCKLEIKVTASLMSKVSLMMHNLWAQKPLSESFHE